MLEAGNVVDTGCCVSVLVHAVSAAGHNDKETSASRRRRWIFSRNFQLRDAAKVIAPWGVDAFSLLACIAFARCMLPIRRPTVEAC